jgi:hypothetical protein
MKRYQIVAKFNEIDAAIDALEAAPPGSAAWGDITGTLADQTDLQTALNGKQASGSYAAASHTHGASDIASGTIDTARLGSGTANGSSYLRGDQTWATIAGGGDVTGPASSVDNEIALFSSTTGKVIKRATESGILKATSGVLSAITETVTGDVLRGDGTFGAVITQALANNAVTNAKLADMAEATIKGRVAAGTGDPQNLTAAQVNALLQPFPVGAVFISVVATNPATLLGYGTWSAFAAGRMLVGHDAGDADFDTAEETGGAKTSSAVVNHTHDVTITDPGHTHTQTTSATDGASTRADSSSGGATYNNVANINSATTGITASTANPAGGVSSFSLMNPYIVVYMWKRTA